MTSECSDGAINNQLTVMSSNEPNLVFGVSGDGNHSSSCDSSYIRYNYLYIACLLWWTMCSLVFLVYQC
jgi:hypothetical protein